MSSSLKEHAWVELDKDNASRGTSIGQFLLCKAVTKANVNDLDFTRGEFEVFDSKENTEARVTQLIAFASGAAVVAADPSTAPGFIKEITPLKRSDLHNLVTDWKQLCGPTPAPPPPPDPTLGETFKASLPFTSGSAFVLEVCDCVVDSVGVAPDSYNVTATRADGSTHSFELVKSMVTSMLSAAPPPTPDQFQVDWDVINHGAFLFDLVKKLPESTKCGLGKVDAFELLAIGQILAPSTCATLAFNASSPFVPSAADGLVASMLMASLVPISFALQSDVVAKGRSWPQDTPSRLANAIKAYRSAGPEAPPQHPLVFALENKAVDKDAFDAFLARSYQLTMHQDRHAWASGASHYVLRGALEKMLLASGQREADISAFAGGMDQGQLEVFLDTCKDKVEGRSLGNFDSVNDSTVNNRSDNSFGSNLLFSAGTSQLLVVKDNEAKTSAQEGRELTQLRLDAQTIASDQNLATQLNALIALKNNMQIDLLSSAVQALKEPVLIRLVQYDGNLRAALQGQFPSLVSECESLRDVLETKLIRAVLGVHQTFVPDRVERAFRHARLGRLSKCRLFHLIDEEDNGTTELPLKQLSSIKETEGKISLVCIALSRLTAVLQISFPSQQATVTTFIPKLQGKLVTLLRTNVDLVALNRWFRVILHFMSRPVRKLAIADASVGLELRLAYDDEWLGLDQGHNELLQQSVLMAHGSTSNSTSTSTTKGRQGGEGTAKQQRKIEEQETLIKQLRKKSKTDDKSDKTDKSKTGKKNSSLDQYEWADKAEKLDPDADGKYAKMVGGGHPLLLAWNKDNPKSAGSDNKPVCWAHTNFKQGCPMKACKFFHKP